MPARTASAPVALVGTTASGKSDLAMSVATRVVGTEIVSVDSMCAYRGMDLATAKPTQEVQHRVRHHLIDLVDPSEDFSVAEFQRCARTAIADIEARSGKALLVGGTGLYLRAVVDDLELPGQWPELADQLRLRVEEPGGTEALYAELASLDPVAATRTTPTNARRIVRALEVSLGSGRPFSSFGPGLGAYPPIGFTLIGLPFDADAVDARIEERFSVWMAQGLLDEVRALSARPGGLSKTARQALGYRELLTHVEEGRDLDECVAEAIGRTRKFARRQWAWFRRDPRIRWIGDDQDREAILEAALWGQGTDHLKDCADVAV